MSLFPEERDLEPIENNKIVKGTITLTYSFEDDFPSNWSREDIKNYIDQNFMEYLQELESIDEVDV